jgi:hypothetical protein
MPILRRLLPGLALPLALAAQAPDPARLKADLFALAAPGLAGRATGEKGQRLAADLVARAFQEAGLRPLDPKGFGGATAFHWPYALERRRLDVEGSRLLAGTRPLKLGEEAFSARTVPGSGEALVLGFGVSAPESGWDEYAGAEVKGKWVVAFDGEPPRPSRAEAQAWSRACAAEAKAAAAARGGALGLVLLQDPRPGARDLARIGAFLLRTARSGRLSLKDVPPSAPPALMVSKEGIAALPGDLGAAVARIEKAGRPEPPRSLGTFTYAPKVQVEALATENVAALVPGADPALSDEFVLLSAHHDHVGEQGGKVHPGADDNASGTAVLMEVARLLQGSRPRRSLLFLSLSGEEVGLFGSQAFVARSPVDLGKVKANLNIDMVGRNSPTELSVTPARVEGAVTTLTEQARILAGSHGLRLTDEADTYWTRSDHYTFHRKGIPSIFFFGGMHADYHKPTDTPEKIDLEKLRRVAGFVRDLALATANAQGAPEALPKEAWSRWAWPTAPGGTAPAAAPR